ncbi:hypothetical protein NL676_033997 [Syzygium grande]|nr:hypothetical protein NL676_033997 [Syzygium grande]
MSGLLSRSSMAGLSQHRTIVLLNPQSCHRIAGDELEVAPTVELDTSILNPKAPIHQNEARPSEAHGGCAMLGEATPDEVRPVADVRRQTRQRPVSLFMSASSVAARTQPNLSLLVATVCKNATQLVTSRLVVADFDATIQSKSRVVVAVALSSPASGKSHFARSSEVEPRPKVARLALVGL